jgi:hypothetical protein
MPRALTTYWARNAGIPGARRPLRWRKLDGRTKEARRLRQIEADLVAHVGGPDRVTAPQRFLIERTAIDIIRAEQLDARMATGVFSDHDAIVAHALRNSVRLALRQLGAAVTNTPSLSDHLSRLGAKGRAA